MAFPPSVGDGLTDGATVFNKAFWDAYDVEVADALEDTTSGGGAGSNQTPAETTAEVIDARGNLASLSDRLADVIDANGQPINLLTNDVVAQSWLRNLVGDAEWLIWPAGDAAAPAFATLSGAGAAVARTGSGLADTTEPEYGRWCAKVTSGGGAAGILTKTVIPAAVAARLDGLGKFTDANGNVTNAIVIARVKCSTGSSARLNIDIGVQSSFSLDHSGNGAWETLWAQVPLLDSLTKLDFSCVVSAGAIAAHFAPVAVIFTPLPTPRMFLPGDWVRKEREFHISGNVTTGARKFSWSPRRPGIIADVQLDAGTAPTGQALIVDVNTWDGAALTSMFSTRPQIADGATDGGAQPDTTYARRCLTPHFGGTKVAGGLVTIDVDQIGSGAAGADLTITIGYLEPARPLEGYLDHNSV